MTKTKKNRKQNKKEIPARGLPEEPAIDKEERGDFGGIPPRDLKKNLGCG